MEKKNSLVVGLLNMLVPGVAHMYVSGDRNRFIKVLIIGVVALVVVLFGGSALQRTPGYPLPQGLCIGVLLLFVYVPLFLSGQKIANQHNMVVDSASTYNSRQFGTDDQQLAKNQQLFNSGLISKQEYDSRKNNIKSKK